MSAGHNPMDKDKLLEELQELQIRLAMASYAERDGKRLLQENEELKKDPFYQTTDEAKQKFDKIINRRHFLQRVKNIFNISYRRFNNVAVILLVFILLFSVSVFTVQAVRTEVLNMILHMEDKYTEIRLGDKENIIGDNLYINWVNAYAPVYIPEGYSIRSLSNGKNIKTIEYTNENEGIIIFHQMDENVTNTIDTEDAEIEKVTIQGKEGLLINKNGLITAAWNTDLYMFTLSAKAEELHDEDVLKIAESVAWME